jgi:hypothetical protein
MTPAGLDTSVDYGNIAVGLLVIIVLGIVIIRQQTPNPPLTLEQPLPRYVEMRALLTLKSEQHECCNCILTDSRHCIVQVLRGSFTSLEVTGVSSPTLSLLLAS